MINLLCCASLLLQFLKNITPYIVLLKPLHHFVKMKAHHFLPNFINVIIENIWVYIFFHYFIIKQLSTDIPE